MKTEQILIKKPEVTSADLAKLTELKPHLVLVFGWVKHFTSTGFGDLMKSSFPGATIIGCTTAGEISGKGVSDNATVFTAIRFKDNPTFRTAAVKLNGPESCHAAGTDLAKQLKGQDLRSVFVLSQGINVNGTPMVEGLRQVLGTDVTITGGLAGDHTQFKETWTLLNGDVSNSQLVAFGIYGDSVEITCGYLGGWKPFGPARKVTKSVKNVLYELDGQPALEVYKKYLGDDAKNLPGAGLRYPLAILDDNEDDTGVIRGVLGIDEAAGSLTFGADVDEGCLMRLMHTDASGLVAGAKGAVTSALESAKSRDGIGIVVSCVARKLVMGEDIEDEIDAVREEFGGNLVTGFYSYGEICPAGELKECKLHNQTMTITWFADKVA